MNLSAQQRAIHEELATGTDNLIVEARAGVGKTTTMVLGAKIMPEANILFTCFNKKIELEGNAKLKALGVTNAKFQTLHSIGFATVRRFWEGVKISENFERSNNLTEAACGGKAPDAIKRLVTKLHGLGREIVPHAVRPEELFDLAVQFECEPDETWEHTGFGLTYVCTAAVEAMRIAAEKKPIDGYIDYSDMLFLPVRNHWLMKAYDAVIVDEAQDLTVAKLEIAQGVCKGRMVIVGDSFQAIYAFCGADSNSLSRLRGVLQAKELKLTQTFRCGQAIVREAQRLVPDFEASDDNHEGAVETLEMDQLTATAGPGDFILSRLNAPLVPIAMRLLRSGKRTRVAGKDIGKGLVTLVRKLKARSVPDFMAKVAAWEMRESTRLKAKFSGKPEAPSFKARMEAILEQSSMLVSLADGAKNVEEVTDRIEALFTDNGLGDKGMITCSSVHKAKGLEADRVFVLTNTLRDSNQEELNIQYVAITRAIHTLVYVVAPESNH